MDSLEDAAEVGKEVLATGRRGLTDGRLGWMRSELDRRAALLKRWRKQITEFEKMGD